MVQALFALLLFPEYMKNKEVEDLIKNESLTCYTENNILHIYDNASWNGMFEELEEVLIKNKIPFDRYSEGVYHNSNASLRIYRPENNFDKTIFTDNLRNSIVYTKDIYELLKSYTTNKIPEGEFLVRLSQLVKENDPALVKDVKPLSSYVKGEKKNE